MKQALELYLHIPFCAKKCNYCDFLSFPAMPAVQAQYLEQLIREIRYTGPACVEYHVVSVFIGGGTPSMLEAVQIGEIMDAVQESFEVDADAEITIECNPGSTLRHKFAAWKRAGINRLSIGLQSADNTELKMLGRIHTFEEFLKCYQGARMEGFENINIDLINCLPMQRLTTWKKTLRSCLMLRPEHVSVYNLILEPGTPFYEMYQKGLLILPDEEEQAQIDAFTRDYMQKQGFQRYEISNWEQKGHACRHNIGYWTGVPYIGFGLGASSYFEDFRWKNTVSLREYMGIRFEEGRPAFEKMRKELHRLSREEEMEEFMFLGLRLVAGVSESRFLARFGQRMDSVYGKQLEKFTAQGLLLRERGRVRLTERGMDLSNLVMSDFLLA